MMKESINKKGPELVEALRQGMEGLQMTKIKTEKGDYGQKSSSVLVIDDQFEMCFMESSQ